MAAAEATAPNAWVSSYLDALLSYGLSSQYAQAPKEAGSAKAPDADRSLASRYYLRSLLRLDEEALKNAWSNVGAEGCRWPCSHCCSCCCCGGSPQIA